MTTKRHGGASLLPISAAPTFLLLLGGCSMGAGDLPADALASKESEGAICTPVDAAGFASFASQVVTNTTDSAITIESLELDGSMTVDEWFLAPVDWDGPGAAPGAFEDQPEDSDANSLEPGARAIVAMTLKAEPAAATAPERVTAQLQSAEGGTGTAEMGYTVATAPVDGACD